MFFIVGLGNPGDQYQNTRHNLGFRFLDYLKDAWEMPEFKLDSKFNAEVSKKDNVILAKPQLFMNRSGQSVKTIKNFYKIPEENVIIIHDDLDIETGEYKKVFDSSSAGHNGIKDIIKELGSQKFHRIRIGIKNEKLRNPIDPADFVISPPETSEEREIRNLFPKIEKEFEEIIKK